MANENNERTGLSDPQPNTNSTQTQLSQENSSSEQGTNTRTNTGSSNPQQTSQENVTENLVSENQEQIQARHPSRSNSYETGKLYNTALQEYDPTDPTPQLAECWGYNSSSLRQHGRF